MKKLVLYLFSLVYGMIVNFRNTLFNLNILRGREFEVTVISVGNITVGGTGKTPHTEHLIQLLSKKFNIAVLSRGYKRKTKGFMVVETDSTSRQTGDEPLQIKMKFPSVMVAVDEKRVRGIEKILEISEINNSTDIEPAFIDKTHIYCDIGQAYSGNEVFSRQICQRIQSRPLP